MTYKQLSGFPAAATEKARDHMPSAEDLKSFNRKRNAPDVSQEVIDKFPAFPDDVRKRFPSIVAMEKSIEEWRVKTNIALRGGPQAG